MKIKSQPNLKKQFAEALRSIATTQNYVKDNGESKLIAKLDGATQMYGRCHHDNFGKTVRSSQAKTPGLFVQFTSAIEDAIVAQEAKRVEFSGNPSRLIASLEERMLSYNRDHRDFTKCCGNSKADVLEEDNVGQDKQQVHPASLKA